MDDIKLVKTCNRIAEYVMTEFEGEDMTWKEAMGILIYAVHDVILNLAKVINEDPKEITTGFNKALQQTFDWDKEDAKNAN